MVLAATRPVAAPPECATLHWPLEVANAYRLGVLRNCEARGSALRIVVIEDDPSLVAILTELLADEGYEVFAQQQSAGAHHLVREVQPAAVLLDVGLPDGRGDAEAGWSVIDRLTLDPATRDTPIVLASGAKESIEARRPALVPHERFRVLFKPYDLDDLLDVLAEVAPAARPAQASRATPVG